jgi:hypothetical protein
MSPGRKERVHLNAIQMTSPTVLNSIDGVIAERFLTVTLTDQVTAELYQE